MGNDYSLSGFSLGKPLQAVVKEVAFQHRACTRFMNGNLKGRLGLPGSTATCQTVGPTPTHTTHTSISNGHMICAPFLP